MFIGTVDSRTKQRYIWLGEGEAVVKHISLLAGHDSAYDWGLDAAHEATLRLAYLILDNVAGDIKAKALHGEYAISVIRTEMETGRIWILPWAKVEQWVSERPVSIQ